MRFGRAALALPAKIDVRVVMTVLGINVLDIIFVVLVLVFAIRGLFHGLLEEVAALFGIFLGFVLANRYLADVVHLLEKGLTNPQLIVVIAYILIFAFSLLLAAILARILRKILVVSFAAWLDHMAGALLGVAKGIILCLLVLLGFQYFAPDSELYKTSVLAPQLQKLLTLLLGVLPGISLTNSASWFKGSTT